MNEIKKEIYNFIETQGFKLNPDNRNYIKNSIQSLFKTKDSKQVFQKTLLKINQNFSFDDTPSIINLFGPISSESDLIKRQEFFKSILEKSNQNSYETDFLKLVKLKNPWWHPPYDVIVVTENEKTYLDLKKNNIPTKLIISETDVLNIQNADTIQILDCEGFLDSLESLPQSLSINSIDEAYLERYLELLSSWSEIIELLNTINCPELFEIKNIIKDITPAINLLKTKEEKFLSEQDIEQMLIDLNDDIGNELKKLTFSGESLISIINKGSLSPELVKIIKSKITLSGIPDNLLIESIPVTINELELGDYLKKQQGDRFTKIAINIKKQSSVLKSIPNILRKLEVNLIYYDFVSGISKFFKKYSKNEFYWTFSKLNSDNFEINGSLNLFLDSPRPISFVLNTQTKCSILTGANSGGKTTLLEHIQQILTLFNLGLPILTKDQSSINIINFKEIYYFAKTKGSMSKGAFETLLTQMSEIDSNKQTAEFNNKLILADEIEAVTEPGVAGKIISATSKYFIDKGFFLIIATHLGQEIQPNLPERARIDGIEAKGLTDDFELIVDHNPIMNKLASSTPELIVEKMANSPKTKSNYLEFINKFLKK